MRARTFTATTLATALLALPGTAQPGPGGPRGPDSCQHHEQMERRLEEELKLTEEQKAKMAKLREERKGAREEHVRKMKEVREKMKEELAKAKPDANKLMGYATQTADLVEQMTKQRIDHLLKVKQILTKEQFERLLSREMYESGKGKGDRRPKRHGKKGPPPPPPPPPEE